MSGQLSTALSRKPQGKVHEMMTRKPSTGITFLLFMTNKKRSFMCNDFDGPVGEHSVSQTTGDVNLDIISG